MNEYSFVCEAWDTGYGVSSSIIDPMISMLDGKIATDRKALASTGVGAAIGIGITAIFTKYFNEVKNAVIESNTAEEAYAKFQDIVYNDRLIFTRRSLLKTPVIDRYFEKLVQRKDPQWKEKILKRLRWCKGLLYAGGAISGAIAGNNTAVESGYSVS